MKTNQSYFLDLEVKICIITNSQTFAYFFQQHGILFSFSQQSQLLWLKSIYYRITLSFTFSSFSFSNNSCWIFIFSFFSSQPSEYRSKFGNRDRFKKMYISFMTKRLIDFLGRIYYPGVVGIWTLPYPCATVLPKRSGPRTETTICGQPYGFKDL